MQVTINVKESVSKNAAHYYERSKKAKKKLEGAKLALNKSFGSLKTIEKKAIKESKKRKEVES